MDDDVYLKLITAKEMKKYQYTYELCGVVGIQNDGEL